MTSGSRPLDTSAFERLCEQLAAATVRCSDAQVLDLADSLHATLRRRRDAKQEVRAPGEARSWID
jgi:hypothetical protein